MIERFYHELWNRWGLAAADEIVSEEIRFRGALGSTLEGRERASGATWRRCAPPSPTGKTVPRRRRLLRVRPEPPAPTRGRRLPPLRIDSRRENMGAEPIGEEGSMSDRRDEERERTRREQEGDERRRDHVERRFDDLKESWRRNHPREEEDTDRDRPRRGREKPE
jgi:hypothetical protein